MKRYLLLACLSLCALIACVAARDAAVETKIEAELAQIDPALVEPFHAATEAMDKNDLAKAAALLAPIVEKAPKFDPALRRYGSMLAAQGRRAEGLKWVEQAVAIKRSHENLATLAGALAFSKGHTATPPERERALTLLKEARKQPGGEDESTLGMIAQLSLQAENIAEARNAIEALEKNYPDLLQTHYFAAVLAAVDEHWIKAKAEILAAQKLGLDEETVKSFLDSGVGSRANAWGFVRGAGWATGLWAGGLLGLCGLGYALSKLTLRQIERADPRHAIAAGERKLRKLYRSVLNVAGVYYYLSLPIVFLLVVGAAAALLYGFLMMGWIPIKLTIIIVIGVIATIWSMGRSLFLKVDSSDPGRALSREEAEPLWQLTETVAKDLNTRPIDEIRITPGTDLCVYERGTWREKLDNQAKRVLVLGVAVLNDFKQDDFRSVLAHEYGHFANRDTAGGDVALRVQNDMLKFYIAMVKAGQATWLNIAFHFLRFYHFIFRRISHGATRLQEVLADRVAAQAYGPLAFEGGLRHVIRTSLHFDAHADREIQEALKARRPIMNLYEAPTGEPQVSHEKAFIEAINRPTTADDTHPAPHDRFRLIAPIPEPTYARSSALVWDLFKDRAAIVQEMTARVEKNIAPHRA